MNSLTLFKIQIHETYTLSLLLISTQFYAQQDITTGLVLCLPMDANAQDFSGNNNHGTMAGSTPTVNRFGEPATALYFNGSSNFITIPHSNSIGTIETNDELTISAWCRPISWYPAWNVMGILEKHNISSDWGWAFALENSLTSGNGNDALAVTNYPTYLKAIFQSV